MQNNAEKILFFLVVLISFYFSAIKLGAVEISGNLELQVSYSLENKFQNQQLYNLSIREKMWNAEASKDSIKAGIFQSLGDFRFKEGLLSDVGSGNKAVSLEMYYKNVYNFVYTEAVEKRSFDTKFSDRNANYRFVWDYIHLTEESNLKLYVLQNVVQDLKLSAYSIYTKRNPEKFKPTVTTETSITAAAIDSKESVSYELKTSFRFLDVYYRKNGVSRIVGEKLSFVNPADFNLELENSDDLEKKEKIKKIYISKRIWLFEIVYDCAIATSVSTIKKLSCFIDDNNSLAFTDNGSGYDLVFMYNDLEKRVSLAANYFNGINEKVISWNLGGAIRTELRKNIYLKSNVTDVFTPNYLISGGIEVVF